MHTKAKQNNNPKEYNRCTAAKESWWPWGESEEKNGLTVWEKCWGLILKARKMS